MHSVHHYAAGALFALALHQAHLHQQSLPSYSEAFSNTEEELSSKGYESDDFNSWTCPNLGLLRPVLRHLNIDSKAWPGIEKTATSNDAEHHINAFLRILSEEDEGSSVTPLKGNLEADLATAVEAIAAKQTETSVIDGGQERNSSDASKKGEDANRYDLQNSTFQNSYQFNECEPPVQESVSSKNTGDELLHRKGECISLSTDTHRDAPSVHSAILGNYSCKDRKPLIEKDSGETEESCSSHLKTLPVISQAATSNAIGPNVEKLLSSSSGEILLKENYFGSSALHNEAGKSVTSMSTGELSNSACENSKWETIETDENNIIESVGSKMSENCIFGRAVEEARSLSIQKKMLVLYELLAGSVTDIPAEQGDISRARRGYDARQRVALRLLATWLDIDWTKVTAMEIMVAYSVLAAQQQNDTNDGEDEKSKSVWSRWKRGGIIGAAALTGGTLLAITGGLAAPAIAAGLTALAPTLGTILPIIGSSGFAAAAAAAGSTAGSIAVAASFGAAGAGLTGSKMARRTGGVDEFGFEGVGENHQQGRLAVGILISGLINDQNDFTRPWKNQDNDLERYALRWETKNLIALSTAIQDWLTSSITRELMKQGAMLTVLSTLVAALAWPSALLSVTDFIDSKWTIAIDRSDKAGKLLAKILLKGLQGSRPVTLIGFSLGARVIFKCLEYLAKKGETGGIIERVVLLGAPIPLEVERWKAVRKMVAGRFINGYSTSDWVLGVVFRASLLTQGLAGIQAVKISGIENVDLTDIIKGHSSYLSRTPEIIQAIKIDNYFPAFPSKIFVAT